MDRRQMRQPTAPVAIAGNRADRNADDEHPRQYRAKPRAAAIARQRRRIDTRVEQAHPVISTASNRFAQGRNFAREARVTVGRKSKIRGDALVFPIAVAGGFGALWPVELARAILRCFGRQPIELSTARRGLGQRALCCRRQRSPRRRLGGARRRLSSARRRLG